MNKTLLNYLQKSNYLNLIKPIRVFQVLAFVAVCTLSTSLQANNLKESNTKEITSLNEIAYFAAWQQGANGNANGGTNGGDGANGNANGGTNGGEGANGNANGGANGGDGANGNANGGANGGDGANGNANGGANGGDGANGNANGGANGGDGANGNANGGANGGDGANGNANGGANGGDGANGNANGGANGGDGANGNANGGANGNNGNANGGANGGDGANGNANGGANGGDGANGNANGGANGNNGNANGGDGANGNANGGANGGDGANGNANGGANGNNGNANGGANGNNGNANGGGNNGGGGGCNKTCDSTPKCDGAGNYTIEYLNAYCECVEKPVAPPTCRTSIICDGQGKITKQQYDPATCGCVTVNVTPSTCPTGKYYDKATCGCRPNINTCTKTCDTKVYCDGYGKLTTQVLNKEHCKCETVAVSKPACGYGKTYDPNTCGCVVVPPVCNLACNGNVVCDGKGNLTKQVLNAAACKCETINVSSSTHCGYGKTYDPNTCGCVVVPPVCNLTCNGTVVCDGKGNLTKQVLNAAACKCETVKISSSTQCGYGKVYDPASCGCVVKPPVCNLTCNGTVVCDGKGNLTKQVLNAANCKCETVKISSSTQCGYGKVYDPASCGCVVKPPVCNLTCNGNVVCDGKGNLTKQVLNAAACKCETVKVSSSTHCGYGKVYSNVTCGCVTKPVDCQQSCNGTVVCDGKGNLTKQVLNKVTCRCETVNIAKPTCGYGKVYDSASCGCVTKATISCDKISIAGSTGSITVSNLTAPMKVVKVFDANWQVVYTCTGGDCKETEVINNLHGTYYVNVGFYTSAWHFVCGTKKYVTVTDGKKDVCDEFTATEVNGTIVLTAPKGKYTYSIMLINEYGEQVCKEITIAAPNNGGSTTCTTIFYRDADGDGFGAPGKTISGCAAPHGYVSNADDCNDANANIPAKPGATCSDGNSKTINDKIQADGCTCAGTVDAAPPADPCAGVTVSHAGGKMDIRGVAGRTYFYKVDRIKPTYKKIIDCTSACNSSAQMNNLVAGIYDVKVYGGADWAVCKDVRIVMGGYSGVTGEDGSSSSRAATTSNTTIDQQHSFYPNPASGALYLNLEEYAGQQGTIKLVDQFGQVVQQANYDAIPTDAIKMDVQRVEDGLHFLNITVDGDKVITEKVMINKF